MKETPILYKTDMIKAYLEGRKLITRRTKGLELINKVPDTWEYVWDSLCQQHRFYDKYYKDAPPIIVKCPYGQVGDRLWGKETYWQDQSGGVWVYKAGGLGIGLKDTLEPEYPPQNCGGKSIPAIFMPRWASRINQGITGIRAERVQDISLSDIYAEGCSLEKATIFVDPADGYEMKAQATEWFATLWDSINAEPKPRLVKGVVAFYESYPWEEIQETRTYRGKPWYVHGNPWLWVLSYPRYNK